MLVYTQNFILENCESIPASTVGKVLSALTNMVKDVVIRRSLVASPQLWSAAIGSFSRLEHSKSADSADLILNLMGLLHNLTFEKHALVSEHAETLSNKISIYLKEKNGSDLFLRALSLFSNLVSRYETAALVLVEYTERLMTLLKHPNDQLVRTAAKCLAALSERVGDTKFRIVKADRSLQSVAGLLQHEAEEARGNGALILSNCVSLLDSEPIELIGPLLKVVDQAKSESVRKNAAIAVG